FDRVRVGLFRHIGRRIAAIVPRHDAIAPREVPHLRLPGAIVAPELMAPDQGEPLPRLLVVEIDGAGGGGNARGRHDDSSRESVRSARRRRSSPRRAPLRYRPRGPPAVDAVPARASPPTSSTPGSASSCARWHATKWVGAISRYAGGSTRHRSTACG